MTAMAAILDFWLEWFSYSWSTSHTDASYQVSSQLAFRFRNKGEKKVVKMAAMVAILAFWSERFYLFLACKSPLMGGLQEETQTKIKALKDIL